MDEEVTTIEWSDEARTSFDNIIEYLEKAWTDKEVWKFVKRTEKIFSLIERYPEMSRPSVKRKNVRIIILDKHTKRFIFINQGRT